MKLTWEEIYVVVDLGTGVDNKAMLAENSYQLIVRPLPLLNLPHHANP